MQSLALDFRGKKASESWVMVLDSKPIPCNRESESIVSTYKYKTLLLLTLMFSFLSEVSIEDTLGPVQIYRKHYVLLVHDRCKYITLGFTTLKGHNLSSSFRSLPKIYSN